MQADTASRSWLAQKTVCLGPMGGTTYTTVQEGNNDHFLEIPLSHL